MNFDSAVKVKYDFNDILIQPATKTDIDSRSQVNPFDDDGMLPIFTAPMDTVVDKENHELFHISKINVCLSRTKEKYKTSTDKRTFSSLSLDEFIKIYIDNTRFVSPGIDIKIGEIPKKRNKHYVLIDIANGHMNKMINTVKKAKEKYGNSIFIMAGNVANPDTYKELSEAGADAVRIGIGNGNGCLTTQQTGIGFPMASLIRECYHRSVMMLGHKALIVADGGMKNYSDIIKALALGADYVMVGSLLNKCLESCGETRIFKYFKIDPLGNFAEFMLSKGYRLTKRFRGMSTKEVQKNWGNDVLKTSEGVVRIRPVEYTLSQWAGNFEDYLRSAMSYTNCKTLEEFRNNVNFNMITEHSYHRFNK